MFVSSKKFVAPLVALIVACMAVEAVTFPANCMCTSPVHGNPDEKTTRTCPLVGQGATLTSSTNCNLPSQGAYDSFNTLCTTYYPNDGVVNCQVDMPDVPLPQSCSCADPSGVNTVAQTKTACDLVAGLGTVVGDKCVLSVKGSYYILTLGCPKWYPGSTAICSAQ